MSFLRRPPRPLLTATAGAASLTIASCDVTGNLMAPPPCPVTQVHVWSGASICADECPAGTAVLQPLGNGYDYCEPIVDAGVDAGDAAPDAGSDAGASDDGG